MATDEFSSFLAKYPVEVYRKGSTILLGGDKPRGIYVVESGRVKTYFISADGEEHLLSIDGADAQIPVGYATGAIDVSELYYEAHTRCRVRIVPRDDYAEHLRTNIDSLYKRHLRMTILVVSLYDRIKALEQPVIDNKIVLTLLYLSGRVSTLFDRKPTTTNLATTQQEIASLSGVSRETVNAGLKNLHQKKLIEYSRKNYTLYKKRIREYIDELG